MAEKSGRPQFPIDWETVDGMCAIQCTGVEIAGVLGCSYNTLVRAVKREKELTFEDYFAQKSVEGKVSLRRKQYDTALEGNTTMLIWLGKQWLGQADRIESSITELPPIEVVVDSRAVNTTSA